VKALVLATCLVLAEQMALVTVQSAQRVERRSVIRWCVDPAGLVAWLERRTVTVVDGKDAGTADVERIYDLRAENTWRLIQGGGS